MKLRGWCWHKFGKWGQPSETIMADGSDYGLGFLAVIQERTCEKCGLIQTHRLPKLRRLKGATDER